MSHPELHNVSLILDRLYLSGIKPFSNPTNLKGIRYVISCVDPKYTSEHHYKLDPVDPDITFVYLPYNDDVYQNLWAPNIHNPTIRKARSNSYDTKVASYLQDYYANKPMIEISYHVIDRVLSSGQTVLVHCMAGVSRSASMIIYYLMRKYGMSFDDAYKLVKSRRSIINPNRSFEAQLRRYDRLRDAYVPVDSERVINHILSH